MRVSKECAQKIVKLLTECLEDDDFSDTLKTIKSHLRESKEEDSFDIEDYEERYLKDFLNILEFSVELESEIYLNKIFEIPIRFFSKYGYPASHKKEYCFCRCSACLYLSYLDFGVNHGKR